MVGFFPLEIAERIVQFADCEALDALLTVSISFQVAVETHRGSWNRCAWPLKDTDPKTFLAHYRGHRCRCLREISFSMEFPTRPEFDYLYHKTGRGCRETADELKAHNERFTALISGLFSALKTLEERELPRNRPAGIQLIINTPNQPTVNNNWECYHREFNDYRLTLLNPDALPSLQWIKTFILVLKPPRLTNVHPYPDYLHVKPLDFGLVPALISKFPNLDVLDCNYFAERLPEAYESDIIRHYEKPWAGPWRDTRHEFGRLAMQAGALPKLKTATLLFGEPGWYWDNRDETVKLPDLTKPLPYDPLSSALRVLSQNTIECTIRACVDETIFWPIHEKNLVPPTWPFLRKLRVEFRPFAPSGFWYFWGIPEDTEDFRKSQLTTTEIRYAEGYEITEADYPPVTENADDEHWDARGREEGVGRWDTYETNSFRTTPRDEVLEPFLRSFARALKEMPCLESGLLFTSLMPTEDFHQGYLWGLNYQQSKDEGSPVLEWRVDGWRPSQELLEAFRSIGADRGTAPLEETWLDCKNQKNSWEYTLSTEFKQR